MRLSSTLVFSALAAVASAHFQLQYPVPRGKFVEDDEPKFCDGYTNVADSRVSFPLSGGFINLNAEHAKWTAGVLISTSQSPKSFDDFSKTLAVPFFQATGEGVSCLKLDLSNTGVDGVKDGANVTIQIQFNGGDGNLFQCADLTLSNSAKAPDGVSCQNLVSTSTPVTTTAPTGTGPSPSSASASSTSNPKSGAEMMVGKASGAALLVSVAAVVLAW